MQSSDSDPLMVISHLKQALSRVSTINCSSSPDSALGSSHPHTLDTLDTLDVGLCRRLLPVGQEQSFGGCMLNTPSSWCRLQCLSEDLIHEAVEKE